jgi:chromosome segregation ATPase
MKNSEGDSMGRIGVIYKDVAKAVNELQGQQKPPTVDNVRQVLGTGSKSTIARLLREWKQTNSVTTTDEASLPTELVTLVKGLWERMQENTAGQAAEYREACDIKIVDSNKKLQEKQKAHELSEKQRHQSEESLHQAITEKKQLQHSLQTKETELAKLNEQLKTLGSKHEDDQHEIKRLHDLLKHIQANLEHFQLATQKLQQEQSLLLEKQQNEHEKQVAQLRQEVGTLTSEKARNQAESFQAAKRLNEFESIHEALEQQHQQTQQHFEKVKTAHENLKGEHEAFKAQRQQEVVELTSKTQTAIELQVKLQVTQENNQALKIELDKALDKIESLRHDYDFVSQEKSHLAGQLKQLIVD